MRLPHVVSLMAPGITTDIAYASLQWYGKIILYLLEGDKIIQDLPELVRHKTKRDVVNYKLVNRVLIFCRGLGIHSTCIIQDGISAALKCTYNLHSHFAVASTIYN